MKSWLRIMAFWKHPSLRLTAHIAGWAGLKTMMSPATRGTGSAPVLTAMVEPVTGACPISLMILTRTMKN
jgi:hypothetical protein